MKSAGNKGSKGFWNATKKFTFENEPRQETADYPKLFYKECMAITDYEKSEIFKQLLKNAMKNNRTESSLIAEHG